MTFVSTVVQVMGLEPPAAEVSTCPELPAVVGRLKLYVPAAACGLMVTAPEVFPASETLPRVVPAMPSVGVDVNAGSEDVTPASTEPEGAAARATTGLVP